MHPPLTKDHEDVFISPPLCLSPLHHAQITIRCFGVGVPQRPCMKFIGPESPPFDMQDMANRFCAISHLFRLLSRADLSCLQAIFKPWAPETYGAMGNFIISALHLSDLIQACCRLCWSMPYIYTLLGQTRAPVTNPTINILAGVTPGEAFLWTALRSRHYSSFLKSTSPGDRNKGNEEKESDIIPWSGGVDQRVKHKATWHFQESQ